jgi:LruC domain-containing protein
LSWDKVKEGFVQQYKVYRSTDGTNYSCVITTDSLYSAAADGGRTNGLTYKYYIVGVDGAGNEGDKSNVVSATPSTTASIYNACIVTFEDLKGQGTNDWDCNDITVKMESTLYLSTNDNVSTVSIQATGTMKDAGYTHDVRLDIKDLQGNATYSIRRYDKSNLMTPLETSSGTYYWGGTPLEIFPDTSAGVTGGGSGDGVTSDVCKITLTLGSPTGNPLSTFDRPPFDTWIYVTNTQKSIHIFDPETGDYADDNQQVQEDPLKGVYLSFGFIIPKLDWSPPSSTQKIWVRYPAFVDYAKSVRTSLIRNPSWYNQ